MRTISRVSSSRFQCCGVIYKKKSKKQTIFPVFCLCYTFPFRFGWCQNKRRRTTLSLSSTPIDRYYSTLTRHVGEGNCCRLLYRSLHGLFSLSFFHFFFVSVGPLLLLRSSFLFSPSFSFVSSN